MVQANPHLCNSRVKEDTEQHSKHIRINSAKLSKEKNLSQNYLSFFFCRKYDLSFPNSVFFLHINKAALNIGFFPIKTLITRNI